MARASVLLGIGVPVVVIGYVVVYAFVLGGFGIGEDDVAQQIRELLWFVAACGLAAYATIEILKRVFLLRGLYQQRQVEQWLNARADVKGAFDQLEEALGLRPKTAPDERLRVFNLPTEQLAAQVSAAAEVAIADPKPYSALLAGLTGEPAAAVVQERSDTTDETGERGYRFAQRVRAGVDQLQISLGERWRRYVQSAAVALAGLYGVALTEASEIPPDHDGRFVLAAVVLGGVLAWVVRDVAAVLERWRR
jgi:hypothetical protein